MGKIYCFKCSSGPLRMVKRADFEEGQSLMECGACGRFFFYQVKDGLGKGENVCIASNIVRLDVGNKEEPSKKIWFGIVPRRKIFG